MIDDVPDPRAAAHVEARLGGAWVDLTGDMLHQSVQVTRGRGDEQAQVQPQQCSIELDNPDGRYTPGHPLSPYYPGLGRGVPIRVRVAGLEPDPPSVVLTDTFGRSEADGWGVAGTGQTWQVAQGDPTQFSVSGGAGRLRLDAVDAGAIILTASDQPADFEAVWDTAVDTEPQGFGTGAVYSILTCRDVPGRWAAFVVGMRTSTGHLSGGLRVSAHIAHRVDGQEDQTPILVIPDLVYRPGRMLRVRCRAEGPELRMRVWDPSEEEPEAWHAQAHIPAVVEPGRIGFWANVTSGAFDTALPATVSVDNVHVTLPPGRDPGIRFAGEAASWEPEWPYGDREGGGGTGECRVALTASGIMRRLGQGRSPADSVWRRAITAQLPLAYWPMEDAEGSTRAASGLPDGGPLRVKGADFASGSGPPGGLPVVRIGEDASLSGDVPPSADTGSWSVACMINMSEDDWPEEEATIFAVGCEGGTLRRFSIRADTVSGEPALRVRAVDQDGTTQVNVFTTSTAAPVRLYGGWRMLFFVVWREAGDEQWTVQWADQPGNTGSHSGTLPAGQTPGRPVRIGASHGGMPTRMQIGHLGVMGAAVSAPWLDGLRVRGQSAREQMSVLSARTGVPLEISGAADTPMGPPPVAAPLDALEVIAAADMGILAEARDRRILTYRGRDTLYNQTAALELDAGDDWRDITHPLAPVLDDESVRNDVTAKRSGGSEARAVDEDGPLGVRTVGRYDESATLDVAADAQLGDQASWRLHLGTWPGMRYPAVSPALDVQPGLAARWAEVDLGDVLHLDGLPSQHPPGGVGLMVQGYAETISPEGWRAEVNVTPAGPWDVWTVTGADPAALYQPPSDTFDDRTETDTWGTSTSGHAWTETGGAASDRAVSGGAGTVTLQSSPATIRFQRIGGDVGDAEVLISVSVDQLPSGGSMYPGVLLRHDSDLEFYRVRFELATDGTVGLQALRVSSGTSVADIGITYAADDVLWLRARVDGHTLRGRAWRDGDPEPEEWQVEHEVTDVDDRIHSGRIGVVASASGSNTNTDPTERFHSFQPLASTPPEPRTRLDSSGSELALAVDAAATELLVATDSPSIIWITTSFRPQDLPVLLQMGGEVVRVTDITGESSPQTMTVERSINGVVKSHPAGTRVRLARTGVG